MASAALALAATGSSADEIPVTPGGTAALKPAVDDRAPVMENVSPAAPEEASAHPEAPPAAVPDRERQPLGAAPPRKSAGTKDAATSAAPSWTERVPIGETVRVGSALGGVIGLMLVLRRAVRSLHAGGRAGRPSGVLEILARYPVARGQTLLVIKLGRRIILAHHGGGTMRALCETADADEVARLLGRLESGASEREAAKFARTLERFRAEYDEPSTPAPLEVPHGEVIDLTRPSRGLHSRRLGKAGAQ